MALDDFRQCPEGDALPIREGAPLPPEHQLWQVLHEPSQLDDDSGLANARVP